MAGQLVALRMPFRAHGKGWAQTRTATTIIQQAIHRVTNTRCSTPRSVGETPWDPTRGTKTHLLKHRRGRSIATAELAQHYILDALDRDLPGVRIRSSYRTTGPSFFITIRWAVGAALARVMTGAPVERTLNGEFELEV